MVLKQFLKMCAGQLLVISMIVLWGVGPVSAEDVSMDSPSWRGGFHIGYSDFTGIIGVELNKANWAVTLGMPAAIGVKYYLDENGYRWFVGAHAMSYSLEKDQTKDGIRYTDLSSTSGGFGMGYKWRWKNHWDLALSLSLSYDREILKNDYVKRTEEYIMAKPGLTFGYTF